MAGARAREPELIAACKRGNKAAGTELLGQHYASSLRLARGILRSEEESQDAVHSAYFSALRHIREFRGDATFKTWITRIVMNECLARLRERRQRRDWVSVDNWDLSAELNMLASAAPNPEKFTLCQEIASALSDAASVLPKSLRDVFALCAFSDLSIGETAAALGLTVGTTKTRLFRGHARMRSHLQSVWSKMNIHGARRDNPNQVRRGGREASVKHLELDLGSGRASPLGGHPGGRRRNSLAELAEYEGELRLSLSGITKMAEAKPELIQIGC